MGRGETEAVLAHEAGHVANADMVAIALLQGGLDTFVILLACVIDGGLSGRRDCGGGIACYAIVFLMDMVSCLFASMVARWFSRHRAFRADAGSAALAGKDKMVAALKRMPQAHGQSTPPRPVAALGSSGVVGSGFQRVMMGHPPLDVRIAALRGARPDARDVRQGMVASSERSGGDLQAGKARLAALSSRAQRRK